MFTMSIRGVWVIRPSPEPLQGHSKLGTVLFSKRYPTVERRCKLLAPSLYHSIPGDQLLCDAVITKCSDPSEEFLKERDSCAIPHKKPVYELFGGKLWPVVCLELNGIFFVAIPLVESKSDQQPPLMELPGVPTALSLLQGVAEVVGSDVHELNESSPKFLEVYQYLCLAAPLGSPIETTPAIIKHYQGSRKPAASSPSQRQPAWRPGVYRGSSKLHLVVKEEIKAVQYGKKEVADVWETFGSVRCKADLEGHPDVLLTLVSPPSSPPLDHLLTHPCVQSADATPISPQGSPDMRNRKVRFSAPSENFTLCSYRVSGVPVLPIRGFYQMKGEQKVQLLMQLKLDENVRNNFDYCEVHLPFFHRGPIQKIENVSPVTANAALSTPDKRTLVWNIGQKFPSKTLELSLQATIRFSDNYSPTDDRVDSDDPFCVGLNTYADIFFKISDFTLSGCSTDSRSVTLFPPTKFKFSQARELVSTNYRIWNSHGDTIFVASQSRTVTS